MSEKKPVLHMIGNAHIDPVWLWRFPEGLAEIKATFRSALDRISEYDEFVFTCACAMYYKWVEENCSSMFEEIREAVKSGKWIIVGGMWVQPDCNMPSSESFARHMLYSQKYFEEKFGVKAKTGYNVDSFGHSSGLPRLLNEGGLENYVYLRPSPNGEMEYPFADCTYRWQCGEGELLTYRLPWSYAHNIKDDNVLVKAEALAGEYPYPIMFFYGVGNHGGGPTITNINRIRDFKSEEKCEVHFSDPDTYFGQIRAKHFDELPCYTGELQNHASGCYSANSRIKALNRAAENRLGEAERMEVLSAVAADHPVNVAKNAEAWQKVLFNQFHDIICGCSIQSAYEDAYAFEGAAIAHGLELTNAAAQRISWEIDTYKEGAVRSKEINTHTWETNHLGSPVVVFNPLSYPVKVPVIARWNSCAAVTDENDNPVPFQMVRAEQTNGALDTRSVRFLAQVPAYGWRTYWVYRERTFEREASSVLQIGLYHMANDKLAVKFDSLTGEIASLQVSGKELLGELGCRTILVDDSPNDTWAHNKYVFEAQKGIFASPTFRIMEKGECQVSLQVTQKYHTSTLERIYTLYPGEEILHVAVRLILNEELVMVKMTFDAGLPEGEFIREVPGGVITTYPSQIRREKAGRELPMLRYMALREGEKGIAVINDGKYSASCRDGEMRMVAARSCYYADHYGVRDGREMPQDMGEQKFCYAICPCGNDLSVVAKAADILNTDFPVIPETYHKGSLPMMASHVQIDADNVTISAVKAAEDGRGVIIRLTENAGRETSCNVRFLDTEFTAVLQPFAIQSYRLADGKAQRCNFLEES